MQLRKLTLALASTLYLAGCGSATTSSKSVQAEGPLQLKNGFEQRLDIYKTVTLKADLSGLSTHQQK
ncbi:MAG: hypothetical protein ACI9FJ_001437, partial [Alteromonadaceae bacterium]